MNINTITTVTQMFLIYLHTCSKMSTSLVNRTVNDAVVNIIQKVKHVLLHFINVIYPDLVIPPHRVYIAGVNFFTTGLSFEFRQILTICTDTVRQPNNQSHVSLIFSACLNCHCCQCQTRSTIGDDDNEMGHRPISYQDEFSRII